MFKAFLFDYNGVLVDDEHVHLEAFREALAPLGVSISETDYWERYLGFDDIGAFRAILEDAGLVRSSEEIRRLVEAKRPLYLARAEGALRGFEGAALALGLCATLGPVGIVSGALAEEIELGLSILGCREQVLFVVSAESTQHSKPDPEGYRLGLARLQGGLGNLRPAEVLVVEDSVDGIRAAKAAGLPCLAVAHSYPLEQLGPAGADLALPHIRDLSLERLESLSRRVHGLA